MTTMGAPSGASRAAAAQMHIINAFALHVAHQVRLGVSHCTASTQHPAATTSVALLLGACSLTQIQHYRLAVTAVAAATAAACSGASGQFTQNIRFQCSNDCCCCLLAAAATAAACSEASGQFTDTIRFPCGARRDYGVSAGVAYIVPTGIGTTRQYHAFLTPQPAKRTASNSSGRPVVPPRTLKGQLQALLRAVRPVWAWHMFSHLLVDADLAMQRSVDINRCVFK